MLTRSQLLLQAGVEGVLAGELDAGQHVQQLLRVGERGREQCEPAYGDGVVW
jgi:hypothetical protein